MHATDLLTTPMQTVFNLSESIRKLERGSIIFKEGQLANEVYLIKVGMIRLSKKNQDGEELNLRICKTGDLIGELTLFQKNIGYFLTAKALTPTEVYVVNKNKVEKMLKSDPHLARDFMRWFNYTLQITQTKFRDLTQFGNRGALCSTLIRMLNSFGQTKNDGKFLINIHLTNQEIGNFCGLSGEEVTRILDELTELKVLMITNQQITIRDINYLKQTIQCIGCSKEICCI